MRKQEAFFMKLELINKRLLTCAKAVKNAETPFAADVGTDHGYLAAYLVQNGICRHVWACDINPRPLSFAKKTIEEYGLSDSVTAVLSNGLDAFPEPPENGQFSIICAGMGGELIADIISRCSWAAECRLILQPMTKADVLRKWLYENGFSVTAETACEDGNFVYSVMTAEKKTPDYECSERYLTAGFVTADTKDGRKYLAMRAARLRRAGEGMLSSADEEKCAEGKRLTALAERLKNESEGIL